jgi:hypothetical protein
MPLISKTDGHHHVHVRRTYEVPLEVAVDGGTSFAVIVIFIVSAIWLLVESFKNFILGLWMTSILDALGVGVVIVSTYIIGKLMRIELVDSIQGKKTRLRFTIVTTETREPVKEGAN